MLQTIRDRTQGWLAGTIVSILILMFALWGINAYFTGSSASTIVAKVNGVGITKERFTMSYEQARRQLQAQAGSSTPLTNKQEAGLKEKVLNELITTEVLKQASHKESFHISTAQVDGYLESIPEFQDNGQFSLTKFQEIMSSSMYTANDLIDLIKTTLLVAQPKLGIMLTSVALPNEVNYTVSLVNQERDIRYLNITSAALQGKSLAPISGEQISGYYQQHQDEFKTPEQVSVDYVELSLKDVMSGIHPNSDELKSFYNENINGYTQPAQWKLAAIVIPLESDATKENVIAAETKAKDILQKIRQGEDFDKYARQFSNSTLQGELQGWVGMDQLQAALQKPVLSLTKATPISEVIQADQGFIILKLLDQKETQVEPFEKVKNKVEETLVRQQAEEKMASLRDQLSELTYQHPDSLEAAAKALNLPIKTTALFTQDKGGNDISSNKKVRDTAFGNDVLALQNNSDVIQVTPETAVVIRVKSHLPPALLPEKSVAKQIQDRLELERSKSQLAQLAEEIHNKLINGASESQLAAEYKLAWVNLGFIGRYSDKVDSAILEKAFQLTYPQNAKNSYGTVQLPNSYAVVALSAVRDGAVKDQKQYKLFAEQVQNSEGLLEYELYKQSLMKKAKILIESSSV
ncbi:MAG TPA: SurA N-terminal domain-containing protein [Gammaproteobacteria bacterium]|nr:SurA N-terminal domain-containing protein [Gammaproteobacteria bacterium]